MGVFWDLTKIPRLGVGMGFRWPYRSDLFRQPGAADFLEITIEHFLDGTGEQRETLDLLREQWPLIPHGLNMSLGSAEGLDRAYLDRVARFVTDLAPPYWSEHICFTRAGGIDIGHLTPLPWSEEALDVLERNIAAVREVLPVPLVLEHITFSLEYPGSTMSESAFLTALLERTGCGLLLDVTNLAINAENFGFDWRTWLDGIPLERVVQLHFVGGHRLGEVLIDSHAHPTPPEVWEVFAEVCRRCRPAGAILERDENLPPFAEIVAELEQARSLMPPPKAGR